MAEGENYNSKNWLTPKNIVIYLVVAAVVYALVYYLFLAKKDNSLYETGTTPPATVNEDIGESSLTVALGEQNDTGESGVATLKETNGQTTVVLEMQNAPEGASQPAHIHAGACPTPGDVVYPLTNVVNGYSETVLDADLATIKAQMPLAVNVHKSAAEIKAYVSCGDFQ